MQTLLFNIFTLNILLLIQTLYEKIADQAKKIAGLKASNQAHVATIIALQKQLTDLEAAEAVLKNKKNSSNSHTPPSKDENRVKKNQSLRTPTGLKVGGQPGHEGKTLECRSVVDEVIKHSVDFCNSCGNDLSTTNETLVASRQVLDIPPIVLHCTEHHVYKKICSCGQHMQGSFPSYVNAAIQYGPNTESLVGYLHTRQFIPYKRMKEFFQDVLKLPISTGGIYNILQRLASKATPVYEQIKQRIEQASVVGADETSMNINGKLNWIWTWQNQSLTYLVASDNRGFKTIENTFANGLPNAVVNHDRYAAHFKMNAKHHQICIAHLLRELNYLDELYDIKSSWSKDFKQLLYDAIELKKQQSVADYYRPNQNRDKLFDRLNHLVHCTIGDDCEKILTLQKKLRSHRNYILYFLLQPNVPPDNNGSERAIRNVVVKRKISGQYKSMDGAIIFATLRSVIDTAIKSGQNALNALYSIAIFCGTE